jgi:hypothetical protein
MGHTDEQPPASPTASSPTAALFSPSAIRTNHAHTPSAGSGLRLADRFGNSDDGRAAGGRFGGHDDDAREAGGRFGGHSARAPVRPKKKSSARQAPVQPAGGGSPKQKKKKPPPRRKKPPPKPKRKKKVFRPTVGGGRHFEEIPDYRDQPEQISAANPNAANGVSDSPEEPGSGAAKAKAAKGRHDDGHSDDSDTDSDSETDSEGPPGEDASFFEKAKYKGGKFLSFCPDSCGGASCGTPGFVFCAFSRCSMPCFWHPRFFIWQSFQS